MPDYFPESDSSALAWARNLVTYAAAHIAQTGYSAADITAMTDALTEYDGSLSGHTQAQAAARAARNRKDEARKKLESVIRPRVRKVQADPNVDPAVLRAMGLRPRDKVRTPVAAPTTAPTGLIDTSQRLQHTIRFWDTESGRRGKPKGVIACEIWMRIGDADSDVFLGTAGRSPFMKEFKAESGGQQAHYRLRWVNSRFTPGPWSETLTATIPG